MASSSRSGRLDPLGPVLAVVAVAMALPRGFDGLLTRDLALYAYAGQQVADGVPPYVGVLNRSGPLAHLVPGAGAWLGDLVGADDLQAMRVLLLVVTGGIVWSTYLLARDVLGARAVGAVAALAVASIPPVILYAVGGPRDKTPMMLLLTAALVAAARGRWWPAGTLLALVTLTWQPALFPGAATCVVAALLSPGGRVRALALGALCGALTTLAFVAWFAAVGALPDALDGFVRIHLSDTYQPGFSAQPAETSEAVAEAYGASTYLLVAGLVLLPLVAAPGALRLARRRTTAEGRSRDVALLALAVGGAVGLAWSYRTFNGWADALVLVPFAVLGLAGGLDLVVRRLPRPAGRALTVTACLALVVGGLVYSVSAEDGLLREQRAEVAAVVEVVPDATMLSIEAPQPLVLAHRTNPSRHQMFRLGLERYVDRTWPGGLAGYADWISEIRPTLLTVGRGAHYDWLLPTLRTDYVRIGTSPEWYWYVDRRTDPATLARLEDAVRG